MSTDARDAAVSIARSLTRADIASADVKSLRTEMVSKAASRIAPIPEVRTALTQLQRNCVRRQPPGTHGWVVEGRDIGTVVFPDARVKIFLTARCEVRAQRRLKELHLLGRRAMYNDVCTSMDDRDALDRSRSLSPLVQAEGACLIDSSDSLPEEMLQQAVAIAKRAGFGPA